MEAPLNDREHPLEIALVWTLAGLICGVFFLVRLGVFDPNKKDFHLQPQTYEHFVEKSAGENKP